MTTVNVLQAKTQPPKLLQQVEAGKTIVIARAGKPSAQLVPINAHPKGIKPPGAMRDQISLGGDVDLPLEEFFEDALKPYETDQSGPATPINNYSIHSDDHPAVTDPPD